MTAPSSSLDWPLSVRRYLTHLTLQRALDQHGGSWQELAVWLYAGRLRSGARLPFSPSLDFLWPMIKEDAAQWEQERAAARQQEARA